MSSARVAKLPFKANNFAIQIISVLRKTLYIIDNNHLMRITDCCSLQSYIYQFDFYHKVRG
jgi:hypothetical protein